MFGAFIAKVQGFLAEPAETFRKARDDDLRTVLMYAAPLLVFDAVMTALVALLEYLFFPTVLPSLFGPLFPAAMFAGVLLSGTIVLLLFTVWVHILVCLAGGQKGIFPTFKALACGLTPSWLFHWIPVIGILFDLWSIVLMMIGIRELQEISSGRALVVMFIAIMVPVFILILLAMYLFIATTSQIVPSPVQSLPF